MIANLAKEKVVTLQVVCSRVIGVPVHWLGRSVMCSGENCPACQFRLPRQMFYAGVCYLRQRRVIEWPSSAATCIDEACRACATSSPAGIVMEMRRSSARDCWRLINAKTAALAVDPMTDFDICRELAAMMRVGSPVVGESAATWLNRVRPSQRALLSQCHLFS